MSWTTGICSCCNDGVIKKVHEYRANLEGVTPVGKEDGWTVEDQVEFNLCQDCIEKARRESIDGHVGYPLVIHAVRQELHYDGEKAFTLGPPVASVFYLRIQVADADRKTGNTRCPHGEASPTICKWCRGSGVKDIKPNPYDR